MQPKSVWPFMLVISLLIFGCDAEHTILESFLEQSKGTMLVSFDFHEYFGYSADIDGDFAIVGSGGAAYIYQKTAKGWEKSANLIKRYDSDGQMLSNERSYYVGYPVALKNDIAVVGVPTKDNIPQQQQNDLGVVHVYRRNGSDWEKVTDLQPATAQSANLFGAALSFDGHRLAVGDPYSECVYVFSYDGNQWTESSCIVPTQGGTDDDFGASVCVNGDVLVVGAENSDLKAREAGAAFIFRVNGSTWQEEAFLVPAVATMYAHFGAAVAVHNNLVVIGAQDYTDGKGRNGAATIYYFDKAQWVREQTLILVSTADTYFGQAVAVFNNTLLIGAPDYFDGGGVFVYTRAGGSWKWQNTLKAIGSDFPSNFGWSVALDENSLLVGAPVKYAPHGYADSDCFYDPYFGAAYIYSAF